MRSAQPGDLAQQCPGLLCRIRTEMIDEVGLRGIDLGVGGHEPGPPFVGEVYLQDVVDDVEAAYDRAVAVGAVGVVPLTRKPWGQTLGYLRDNNGFLVEMSDPAAW